MGPDDGTSAPGEGLVPELPASHGARLAEVLATCDLRHRAAASGGTGLVS
jgi:hypothetical protein